MPVHDFVHELAALDGRLAEAVNCLAAVVLHHSPVAFDSSFSAEDMVVLDLIAEHQLPVEVFTLDTGRLPEETQALIERARTHYGLTFRVMYPDTDRLEWFARTEGANAFYRSVELRKRCCEIRKMEPLERALAGRRGWITGLRREQAVTRVNLEPLHWDDAHGLMKCNPLTDWSERDVWTYVRARGVPYSELYDRGYRSVGCAPCTRAVTAAEDVRNGRWWWEGPENKECGLHVNPVDHRVRQVASLATP